MSYFATDLTVGNLLKTIADYPKGMSLALVMDTDGLDTPEAKAMLRDMQADGLLVVDAASDSLCITDKGRQHPAFSKPTTGQMASGPLNKGAR